jgi:hypothetical protein
LWSDRTLHSLHPLTVILGQVMTRLHINPCFWGPGAPPSKSNTCKILFAFFVVVVLASIAWLAILITYWSMCMSECIADSNAYLDMYLNADRSQWDPSTFNWHKDYCAQLNGWYGDEFRNELHVNVLDIMQECSSPAGYAFFNHLYSLGWLWDLQ